MGWNLFSLLTFAGIFLCVLMVLVVNGNRRGNRTANRLLSLFLLLVAGCAVNIGFFIPSGLFRFFPHLLLIPTLLVGGWGPLLCLYCQALMLPSFRLQRRQWLHFLPSLLVLLAGLPFFLTRGCRKIEFIERWMAGHALTGERRTGTIVMACLALQMLFYLKWLGRMIKEHGRDARIMASGASRINLAWMRHLRNILACSSMILVILFTGNMWLAWPFALLSSSVAISFTILTGFLAYRAFRQPEVYTSGSKCHAAPEKKYRKTGLPGQRGERCFSQLLQVMTRKKPYTDPDLTLADLANLVGLSTNHMSQVINQYKRMNFYDFVNEYRVEEAKRMLRDLRHGTDSILDLALEAGFNSKSTFNKAFRRFTGLSPTEFRRQARPQAERAQTEFLLYERM